MEEDLDYITLRKHKECYSWSIHLVADIDIEEINKINDKMLKKFPDPEKEIKVIKI